MTIYEKAINLLLGTSQEDLNGVEHASIAGLILGSMTEVERRAVAGKIADLEAKIIAQKNDRLGKGGARMKNV